MTGKLTKALFWRAHVRLLLGCLAVWFMVSFGCGILFADALNAYSIGNVPLGFWFAQQGAIYAFLLLIVFYAYRVGKLEDRLRHEPDDSDAPDAPDVEVSQS